ncbi:hypothetical protein DHW03_08800 [Pedobacter yonginense]|uniref:Uncharacterized protein n=1 Tax=Pedobacter yonginense TaxID=651869 RepID=A0A317EP39_9SPHI|nr:hypothetical protein [Pedobacter yonginense]PWS27673.1 hypothetical protein DHW03_08800 [Pedobacter yonginense]
MIKCVIKYLFIVVAAIFLFSCSNTNSKPLIKFSGDSSSIIIKNIDEASLLQVKNAFKENPDSLNLVSVLLTPNDQDSLQIEKPIKGAFNVSGDSVIFKPAAPFVRGKSYLIESFIGVNYADARKLLTNGIKHNLQPQQQILTR